jgi:small subunit ribosomal protein S21
MSKNFVTFGDISNYMIIVNIDNKTNLEKALKQLKSKVIKTKQTEVLRNRKEYIKKSIKLRNQRLKAIYKQKITNSQ